MKKYTVTLTLLRHTENDLAAMKAIISACIYRPFQIRFARNFNPPDEWTMTIPECNESAKNLVVDTIEKTAKMYDTKYTIKVT